LCYLRALPLAWWGVTGDDSRLRSRNPGGDCAAALGVATSNCNVSQSPFLPAYVEFCVLCRWSSALLEHGLVATNSEAECYRDLPPLSPWAEPRGEREVLFPLHRHRHNDNNNY